MDVARGRKNWGKKIMRCSLIKLQSGSKQNSLATVHARKDWKGHAKERTGTWLTSRRVLKTAVYNRLHQFWLEEKVTESRAVDRDIGPSVLLLASLNSGLVCLLVCSFLIIVIEEISFGLHRLSMFKYKSKLKRKRELCKVTKKKRSVIVACSHWDPEDIQAAIGAASSDHSNRTACYLLACCVPAGTSGSTAARRFRSAECWTPFAHLSR